MRFLRPILISLFETSCRVFLKTSGVFIIAFASIAVVSVFKYSKFDTSFNTSSYDVGHILLSISPYISDFLLQVCGIFGACAVVIVLFKQGVMLVLSKKSAFTVSDIIFAVSCCLCAHVVYPNSGGVIGGCTQHVIRLTCGEYAFLYNYACVVICLFSCFAAFKNVFSGVIKRIISFLDDVIEKAKVEKNEEELDQMSVASKDNKTAKQSRTLGVKRKFELPSTALLKKVDAVKENITKDALISQSNSLITVLNDFGVSGEISSFSHGPVVTLFELQPAAGIKSSRIIGLASDIARYMSAVSARVAVIPGKNALGIELPNKVRSTVYLRPLLESKHYRVANYALPIILGRNIGGEPIVVDLAKMPHLLIAGTTGSGKSVGVNAMILSLLYKLTPNQCKFIMVDPKMLELSVYNDIPHLLTPVVTDPKKAVLALKWAVREMENRYIAMSKIGVRNIEGYNEKVAAMKANDEMASRKVQTGFDTETGLPIYEEQLLDVDLLPYIVVVVDEMADLMLVAGKDIEIAVQRLAQMARAAGIHLIMATQRPSVDVITGTIKANFPTRISFQVSSKIDSRTILGEQGAEQLLGQGDMLYMASGGRTTRIHGPFVSDTEVESVVNELRRQGRPRYVEEILLDEGDIGVLDDSGGEDGDPLYAEALKIIRTENKVSTSFLQRKLQIGYNRAARIVDLMEKNGVVSAANHVGKREIL